MKISSIFTHGIFESVFPTLILYPNPSNCASECLPLLEGGKGGIPPSQWFSVLAGVRELP